MHLSVWQKRWLGLILIVFLAAAGIQLGYAQGYASPHPGMQGEAAGAVVRDTVRVMETQGQAETPGWRSLSGAVKAECAGQSGTYRDFFPDCYYARRYSGAFTRIFLPSCRIENLYVRSHVLMIAYIHCQDGAKDSGLL